MTRDDRRKPNTGRQEPPRYPRRSPALDAIERGGGVSWGGGERRRQAARRNAIRGARYAADESVSGVDFNSVGIRKLPPLRPTSKTPAIQAAAAAPELSEEEANRLSELEMRLPRVAGKIDSWLLIIVLKFGTSVYGASRWIALGSFFSFQPSELTKLVLALYIADWLARKGKQVGTFLYGLAPFVILVGFILGLVLLENDLGTAIIIAGLATVMFFTAGANIVQFLLAMVCGSSIFVLEAFRGYRYFRLLGFLDPFKSVTGFNLQLYQGLLALGSGGWFGLGLGASREKTGYLPFPYSDSIFPIIGEELGFVMCAIIVILYLFLAFRGFRLARRSRDLYGALLATGITTWLVLQAIINIGANTGSIPYTGVPLPFISFGGSSLVVSLAGVGVLLNISRYIQEPATPALSRQTIGLRKKRVGAGYITSSQQA